METFHDHTFLDPARVAREEGRIQGRREMRDRIRAIYAVHASTHYDPEIRRELWTFINHIEREPTT